MSETKRTLQEASMSTAMQGTYNTTVYRKRTRKQTKQTAGSATAGTVDELRQMNSDAAATFTAVTTESGSVDPVEAQIKEWRCNLGLSIEPQRVESKFLGFCKPIVGIKDLRQLSKKFSSVPAEAKNDNFDFMYCIRNDQIDAYALKKIEAREAQGQNIYYTVSAHCISQVNKDGTIEVTSVPRWFWERKIFNLLVSIPFFHKFMERKVFIWWKGWILHKKWNCSRMVIEKRLFFNIEVLQLSLLRLRRLIENTLSYEISLLVIDPSTTYTLEEFMEAQMFQIKSSQSKLVYFREVVVSIVVETCKLVVVKEGIAHFSSSEFDKAPTHVQVLEWRKALNWLRQYVQLCDFMVNDFLRRLVMCAVETLHSALQDSIKNSRSVMCTQVFMFKKMSETLQNHHYTQNILQRIDTSDEVATEDLPLRNIMSSSLRFQTSTKDYETYFLDMFGSHHEVIQIQQEAAINNNSNNNSAAIWKISLLLKPNSSECNEANALNYEISLSPSLKDFSTALDHLLDQYKDMINNFGSLLKDSHIMPLISTSKYDFLMVLEEEEHTTSQTTNSNWSPAQSLVCDYTPYLSCICTMKATLDTALDQSKKQVNIYNHYCTMVQNCIKAKQLLCPVQKELNISTFQMAFAFCHDLIGAMKMMVMSFRVGLVQVVVRNFHDDCLCHPQEILAQLECQLPILAHKKCDWAIRNLKESFDKLTAIPTDIESFMEYLGTVERMSAKIARDEANINYISKLYTVAQEFNVPIHDEELALYKILFPQLRQLKNMLMQAEATKSENSHHFSSQLKSEMISLLHKGIEVKQIMESPTFFEGSQDPERTLEIQYQDILLYHKQLQSILMKAKRYFEYYQLLSNISTSRRYHTLESVTHSWTPEEVCKELSNIEQSLDVRKTLFELAQEWSIFSKEWSKSPLKSLKMDELQQKSDSFIQTLDYIERSLPGSSLLKDMREQLLRFCSYLPTVFCLVNSKLKMRHWEVIEEAIGVQIGREQNVSILKLSEMKAFEKHLLIAQVSNSANHEFVLENLLTKVSQEWMSKELTLVPYSCSMDRHCHILGNIDDLLLLLDDALTTLAAVKSSRYVTPIQDLENRLLILMEVIELWIMCQKNWVCLEAIFSSMDLQRQLHNEARLFQRADRLWKDLVHTAANKLTALKFALTPGILELFESCNSLLEQVFRNLHDYLTAKRLLFPRFCFISDNELVNILSHTRDPIVVQPYLTKLFGNIRTLEFSDLHSMPCEVSAVISTEGERMKLFKALPVRGNNEQWLSALESLIKESVKLEIKQACMGYSPLCRSAWSLKQISQATLTAMDIIWTSSIETCLNGKDVLSNLLKTWLKHVQELANHMKDIKKPSIENCILTGLLTLDVNRRDIVKALVACNVTSPQDFQWIRHLRHYWQQDIGSSIINQCLASFSYGNEYLGCPPRLVITPLTERCFLTLTLALHLHLGGSAVGPSGTGKSETIKDLAKTMGRLCIVINCSEGLDHKMMGRFHSGMCQSGFWCCFDEFNRINIEVLSVIAQQLAVIKAAKDNMCSKFIFENMEINLFPECGVFMTMNPGYTGRFELPDNLKILFRPVSMIVPDTTIIIEVSLLINGFSNAPSFAKKLAKLYQFAMSLLSQQAHYDFGMRSVKAVISLAGEYLQHECGTTGKCNLVQVETDAILLSLKNCNQPKLISDDVKIMDVLVHDIFKVKVEESNQQMKMLKEYLADAVKQAGLEVCPSELEKCLQLYSTALVRHGVMIFGPTGSGKSTIIKLLTRALNTLYSEYYSESVCSSNRIACHLPDETAREQVVFPPTLKAVSHRLEHCEVKKINTKCLSLGELYGYQDLRTLEWVDGVLSKTLRTFFTETQCMSKKVDSNGIQLGIGTGCQQETVLINKPDGNKVTYSHTAKGWSYPFCAPCGWKWVILDGPVDAGWVENLNSTLDDSKLLCLSSGERIELGVGVRVVFETDDLSQASPATISRCGIVFMDPLDLGWKPYVHSWIGSLPQNFISRCRDHLMLLFEVSIDEGVRFLKQNNFEMSCAKSGISAVHMLCCLMKCLLDHFEKDGTLHQLCTLEQETFTPGAEGPLKDYHKEATANIYIPSPKSIETSGKRRNAVGEKPSNEPIKNLLNKLYVFAFTWSFGGNLELVDNDSLLTMRETIVRGGSTAAAKFDALMHQLFTSNSVGLQLPTSSDLIYSYYVDISNSTFAQWEKLLQHTTKQKITASKNLNFLFTNSDFLTYDIGGVVPTVDYVRLVFLMTLLHNAGQSIILCGKQGVGKTKLLHNFLDLVNSVHRFDIVSKVLGSKHLTNLSEVDNEYMMEASKLHISSQTKPLHLQSLFDKCWKRGRPVDKTSKAKLLVCLDDLHMATPEQYGSIPCLELLRQILEEQGCYDKKSLNWKVVEGVLIVATIGELHRTLISERLLAKFCTLTLSEPSTSILTHIYSTQVVNYLQENKFHSDIVQAANQLVSTIIHTYKRVLNAMFPSPQSPHLIFTTHDLSKVLFRVFCIDQRDFHSVDDVIHLMNHELLRTFSDRCNLIAEREMFLDILSDNIRINFQKPTSPASLKRELFLYEDFTTPNKRYTAVTNLKELQNNLEKAQFQLNNVQDKSLNLLFFPLACEHMVRATRVLQQPGGHLLMVGINGVGRRSCVRLACHIARCHYHPIFIDYKLEYKDVLKSILITCGIRGEPCVAMTVWKGEAEQDSLLHDLQELVVCGEVNGLFNAEEMDDIFEQLADTKATTYKKCWSAFIKRVQQNLHVVICCSAADHALQKMCSYYRSLVVRATTNVFDDWPSNALLSVAEKHLHSCEWVQEQHVSMDTQTAVASAAVKIHEFVTLQSLQLQTKPGYSFHVTPSSFIHFLKVLCKILQCEHTKITSSCHKLEIGITHLNDTDNQIFVMQKELQGLQPKLQLKANEADALMHQLSLEQQEAHTLKGMIEMEHNNFVRDAEYVATLAKVVEKDLQLVLPALTKAERGLNTLKKAHFIEIKSYSTPPAMVMYVMGAVCELLQEPTDWNTVKCLLSNHCSLLKRLSNFDKDHIPDKVFTKLQNYTENESFTPENVACYSVACKSFCEWVLAIKHYATVYKLVQPKKQSYEEINVRLCSVRSQLFSKESQLKEIEATLSKLQDSYDRIIEERMELQRKYDDIAVKLQRAEVLSASLRDEQVRWKESLVDLQQQRTTIVGNSLILSAFLTYSGAFAPTQRQQVFMHWKEICKVEGLGLGIKYSVVEKLIAPEIAHEWHILGLPKDTHSIENAAIITNCEKWPLIVDPEGQATRWLKNYFKNFGLITTSYLSTQLQPTIEQAMRIGLPVLVEDVQEHMKSFMDLYLEKSLTNHHEEMENHIGKTDTGYNSSFRLFLICNYHAPRFCPEVCTKTTIVNFVSTFEALEDQLLSFLIRNKEPVLEELNEKIILSICADKKQLSSLESNMLQLTHKISDNILDSEEVIHALKEVKQAANGLKERICDAEESQRKVDMHRRQYQPIATRGSILYFCLSTLRALNPLYQYSLIWFQTLFCQCIHDASLFSDGKKEISKKCLAETCTLLTNMVFQAISIGLSTNYVVPFAFKLCTSIQLHGDSLLDISPSITEVELATFIQDHTRDIPVSNEEHCLVGLHEHKHHNSGYGSLEAPSELKNPDFISTAKWNAAHNLELKLQCFSNLQRKLCDHARNYACTKNADYWETFLTTPFFSGLSVFQQLIFLKHLVPQFLLRHVMQYIEQGLGTQFISKPLINLKEVYKMTNNRTPVMFILIPGTDPTTGLCELAKDILGNADIISAVSLGQGQEEKAKRILETCMKTGTWALLQNCHYASSWMPELENIFKSFTTSVIHPNFRLWLSSMPTVAMPQSVTQNCIKVSVEPPSSIKSILKQLLSINGIPIVSKDTYQDTSICSDWKQLVIGLCYFHSVITCTTTRVCERRACWNVPYEYIDGNLKESLAVLGSLLPKLKGGTSTSDAVECLVGDIIYGGRGFTVYDQTYLRTFIMRCCKLEAVPSIISNCVQKDVSYETLCSVIDDLHDEEPSLGFCSSLTMNSSIQLHETFSKLHMDCCFVSSQSIELGHQKILILERCATLLEKLPKPSSSALLKDSVSPLWTFLKQEILQWNERLNLLNTSITEFLFVVKKQAIMDAKHCEIYRALSLNIVPQCWQFGRTTYDELSLKMWMSDLIQKFEFIKNWTDKFVCNQSNTKVWIPKEVWLPAVINIKGFFAAITHEYCTKYNCDLNSSFLSLQIGAKHIQHCTDAVIVTGVYLSGAQWDSERGLIHQMGVESYCKLPGMVCLINQKLNDLDQGCCTCPLYSDCAKTDLIGTVQILSHLHWTDKDLILFPHTSHFD